MSSESSSPTEPAPQPQPESSDAPSPARPTEPRQKPSAVRRIVRFVVNTLLAVLVILAAIRMAAWFRATAVEPPRDQPENLGALVETQHVDLVTREVEITGFGNVIAARTATLRPQVAGRVVWLNEALTLGGQFPAGTELVRIDARDYRLAVEELATTVEQARANLELERGREQVAEREWELLRAEAEAMLGELGEGYEGLATREPQIRSARAQVDAARSRLERARLDLSRTRIEAPFNAIVQQETVEVGDLVTQQSALATLVGTDEFWVQVAVPIEALRRISVPDLNAAPGQGSLATVTLVTEGPAVHRRGEVLRVLGDLDPQGRMARLLVSVERPLEVAPGELPILLDAYVRVTIHTSEPVRGVEVPRRAIHEGNLVYVFRDGALDIREVEPLWSTEDTVIVGAGLSGDELVITSPLAAPMPGMKLRTVDPAPALVPRSPPSPAPRAEPTGQAPGRALPGDLSDDAARGARSNPQPADPPPNAAPSSPDTAPGGSAPPAPSGSPREVLEK